MVNQDPTAELDNELTKWLDTMNDEPREVIVEARVPQRRVRLGAGVTPGSRAREVITEKGPSRETVLEQLQSFLSELFGNPPRILRAAGAIAVLATRDQVRQIVSHPSVKAVRANRKLP